MPDTILHRNLNPPNPHVNVPHSTRQHRYSDLVELGDYRHPQTSPGTPYNGSTQSSGARRDSETEMGSQQRNSRYLSGMNAISQLGIHEGSNQGGLGRSVSIGNGNGAGRSGNSSRMAYSPQTHDYSPVWNERSTSQQPQFNPANVPPPPLASNMRRGMSHDAPPQSTPQSSLLPTSYSGFRAGGNSRLSGDWTSIGSVGGAATSHLPSSSMFADNIPILGRHDSYSPSHYVATQSRSIPPPASNSFYTSQSPTNSSPAHRQAQPQPQQYYQSQQYLDSKHASSLAAASSSRLPAQAQPHSAQYYGGPEGYHSTPQRSASTSRSRRNGFRRVRDVREIETVINIQPAGRRGDPETGGFISVSRRI